MTTALHRREGGFGLVELMISMLIGLFLLGGMMTIFITNKQAYRYQQAQGNQNDHERLATTLLGHLLRQAGHTPMDFLALSGKENALPAKAPYFAAGQAAYGLRQSHQVTYRTEAGSQTANMPRDAVVIRFLGGDSIIDCLGNEVPAGEQRVLTFFTHNKVLQCNNRDGTTTQTVDLIGDVHAKPEQQLRVLGLQALWGVDSDGDDVVDVFKRADAVTDWKRVQVVDLEITFQSGLRRPRTTHFTINLPNINGFI